MVHSEWWRLFHAQRHQEAADWQRRMCEVQARHDAEVERRKKLGSGVARRLDEELTREVASLAEQLQTHLERGTLRELAGEDGRWDCFRKLTDLILEGAGTALCQCYRPYSATMDVVERPEDQNLAFLFVRCITAVDSLADQSSHLAETLADRAGLLFEGLVQAAGDAVAQNNFGFVVAFYHHYEEVHGSIGQLCRQNVFRRGCLFSQSQNTPARERVLSHAALSLAWRTFELQVLRMASAQVEPSEVQNPARFTIRMYLPGVEFADLLYSIPTELHTSSPEICQLRWKALRLYQATWHDDTLLADLSHFFASFIGIESNAATRRHCNLDVCILLHVVENMCRNCFSAKRDGSTLCQDANVGSARPVKWTEGLEDMMVTKLAACIDGLSLSKYLLAVYGPGLQPRFEKKWCCLTGLHQRVLLRTAPQLAFIWVSRRMFCPVKVMLTSQPALIGAIGKQHPPELGRSQQVNGRSQADQQDLLTWTCGQRGVVHELVRFMLSFPGSSFAFAACAALQTDDRYSARNAAMAAAESIRNRRTIDVLRKSFAANPDFLTVRSSSCDKASRDGSIEKTEDCRSTSLFTSHTWIVLCRSKYVKTKQAQMVRAALRGKGMLFLAGASLARQVLGDLTARGCDGLAALRRRCVGQVAFILTNVALEELKQILHSSQLNSCSEVHLGAIAPHDVYLQKPWVGPKLCPHMKNVASWLENRGCKTGDFDGKLYLPGRGAFKLIEKGEKAGAEQASLCTQLQLRCSISFGFKVLEVYNSKSNACYGPEVLQTDSSFGLHLADSPLDQKEEEKEEEEEEEEADLGDLFG
eukprot:TRINITY_DN17471_c0_g1_i2.p1 TRINITY_DN17471_c0_g1~~TRINITY_DN17471_c0_g1_i2.p1  ORF type:complete len:891 (-),score=102.84 TRINITY_DN17471_c0_g1_i2:115-2559(-)